MDGCAHEMYSVALKQIARYYVESRIILHVDFKTIMGSLPFPGILWRL